MKAFLYIAQPKIKLQVAFIYSDTQHTTFQKAEQNIKKAISLLIRKALKNGEEQ